MKRVLTGGFLSLLGSIWALTVLLVASNHLVSEWSSFPGRLLTSVSKLNLTFMFGISVFFVFLGVGLMLAECFRKENR